MSREGSGMVRSDVAYVGKIKPKFLRDVERNLNDVCLDL